MSFKSNLINIVLVETSHPGNIGSVARAMKTMGLSSLSLVNPRKFPSGEANALSGNAGDVLENAQKSLIQLKMLSKTVLLFMQHLLEVELFNGQQFMLKRVLHLLIIRLHQIKKFQFYLVERIEVLQMKLQLANTHIEIPANPEYPVLNLAMSAQIVCYEIFKSHFNQEPRDWHDYPEVDSENLTNANRSFY